MKSAWNEREAKDAVERYGARGVTRELALRVYSTRLLGCDPKLVLHGGGNTSLKAAARDVSGAQVEALYVKGSGSDMGVIEPAGFPAVRLEPLRALRTLETLSHDDMARVQRGFLIDPLAPAPSVEMLLHAFMPAKFVDHTHATAVLSLIDQPDSERLCADVYDGRMGFVPYRMPGFGLAKLAADVFEKNPQVEGLILDKHGLFTFGDDARQVLRAHDRDGDAGRAAPAEKSQSLSPAPSCRAASLRSPTWRRSCAAPARCAMSTAKAPTGGRSSISASATRSSLSSTARTWRVMPAPA